MTKYYSKIDSILLLPLLLSLGGGLVFMLLLHAWIGLMIMVLASLFIAHIFLTTYYTIDSHILSIRSGYLVNRRIDIDSITEIAETRDAISSPALSFDRLYIRYNQKSDVIVSPKDKEEFIQKLVFVNPSIKVTRN